MMPIDLDADPLAAAVRARLATDPRPVWIARLDSNGCAERWCVLRSAHSGGLITTLCCDQIPAVKDQPHNACPACCTELAAGTPGAAMAVERPTVDLRRPSGGTEP